MPIHVIGYKNAHARDAPAQSPQLYAPAQIHAPMISVNERKKLCAMQFIEGLLALIVGIAIAILGEDALDIILIVIGVLLVIGAVLIFLGAASVGFGGGGMLMGGLYLLLGLILILVPALISDVLMALLAVGLIVLGVLSLLGIPAFGLPDSDSKIVNVAVAVLMIVTGIIALFNLDDTADVVMIVIGAFVAAAGIVRMYGAYRLKGVIA